MAGIEDVFVTDLNQIPSRIFAVESGWTSVRHAIADIAGRAFRNMTSNRATKTLRDAVYDPQVAVDLANASEAGQIREESVNRFYAFLISSCKLV